MPSFFISSNFMLNDIIELLIATAVMPLFILIPGYVLGWMGNIFVFRERRMVTRLLIGISLSVTVFPEAIYLISRLTSFDLALSAYVILWVIFLWLVSKERKRIRFTLDLWTRIAVLLTFIWILVAILSLPDIQVNQQIYANSVSFDHQTRIALTDSIFLTGIPPANPHIYPGKPLPVSYFYFWYIFPALLSRLTRGFIDARIAFYAGIIWVGIALRATACLYLRLQSPEAKQAIGPRCAVAIGLFFITGLDIIFALIHIYFIPGSPFVTEGWNGNSQVTAWSGASLWVPHHVAGLVAGIIGILIFQSISRDMSIKRKALLIILTSLSLASLVGLSLYVALIFAIFWVIYFACALVLKNWRYRVPLLIATGCLTFLLSFPFLIDLFRNRTSFSTETQGSFLIFEVRKLGFLDGITIGRPDWQVNLFNLVLLPVNYFLELGFFLLVGLLYLQAAVRKRRILWDNLAVDLLLLTSSGFICSFFRSAIIGNNDIGWRGFMPVQFILLIWGTNVLIDVWKKKSVDKPLLYTIKMSVFVQGTLVVVLAIGLISTLFDLSYLRVFSILDDTYGWTSNANDLPGNTWGERNYALREAYQYINNRYPLTAIVQSNPQLEYLVKAQELYGFRQTAAAGIQYSFIYGDSPNVYKMMSVRILPIFQDSSLSWQEIKRICRANQINVLLVKDLDPVWKDLRSWVWSETSAYQNDFTHVLSCNMPEK